MLEWLTISLVPSHGGDNIKEQTGFLALHHKDRTIRYDSKKRGSLHEAFLFEPVANSRGIPHSFLSSNSLTQGPVFCYCCFFLLWLVSKYRPAAQLLSDVHTYIHRWKSMTISNNRKKSWESIKQTIQSLTDCIGLTFTSA